MSSVIVIDVEILQSTAFLAIRSAHSIRVLLEFYRRRKIHKPKDRRGKHSKPVILNNGELVFTFRDATQRMKLSQTTFSRALTELVALGFLDVAEPPCGLHRQPTKWALSERWRRYGQTDFVYVQRERLTPPFVRKRKITATISESKTE